MECVWGERGRGGGWGVEGEGGRRSKHRSPEQPSFGRSGRRLLSPRLLQKEPQYLTLGGSGSQSCGPGPEAKRGVPVDLRTISHLTLLVLVSQSLGEKPFGKQKGDLG